MNDQWVKLYQHQMDDDDIEAIGRHMTWHEDDDGTYVWVRVEKQ